MNGLRWGPPILSVACALLAINLKSLLPGSLDWIAFLMLGGSSIVAHGALTRSMAEGAVRLLWGATIFQSFLWAFQWGIGLKSPVFWVFQFLLLTAFLGPLLPRAVRANAYGLGIAALWTLCFGAIFDRYRTGKMHQTLTIAVAVVPLMFMTGFFCEWRNRGEYLDFLRRPYRRWLHALREDEEPPVLEIPLAAPNEAPAEVRTIST